MKKIILTLALLLSLPVYSKGVTSLNAEELIGTWRIYNEANSELAAINITLAITKEGVSNFTYQTLGNENSADEILQGKMVNQKQVIFETFSPGESNTYVFDIDFDNMGGPGLLLKTVYADCETVGVDTELVKSRFEKRLASSSMLCNEKDSEESTLTNLKLVKDGTDPATIATTAGIPSDFTSKVTNVSDQIESAWTLNTQRGTNIKFLIKDTQTNFLGFQFIYRVVNRKQKLKNLTEQSFKSSERIGILLDEYLVINSSFFNDKNGLSIVDLTKKRRKGRGDHILTPNGDCFPTKSSIASQRICTPNFDTSLANSVSKRSSRTRARRINTKTKISF
jgi:hypothetical protein